MAKKSAALIGPGKGPDVRTAWSRHARVQIRGLKEDEFALVTQKLNEQEDVVLPVQADGIHDLIECAFVSVHYEGRNRNFIACVLIGG